MNAMELTGKDLIAYRTARLFKDGDVVNLGIGMPTKCLDYLPEGVDVWVDSENGVVGLTGAPKEGEYPFSGAHRVLPAPDHRLYPYHVCVPHGEGLPCRSGNDQHKAVPHLRCHLLRRVCAGVSGGLFPDLEELLPHRQSEAVNDKSSPAQCRRAKF